MFEGTFYLTGIDEKYRRFYAYKGDAGLIQEGASIKSAKTSEQDNVSLAGKRLKIIREQVSTSAQTSSSSSNKQVDSLVPKNNGQVMDPSVLRSVQVNFHKKPIQERLNEVNISHKL